MTHAVVRFGLVALAALSFGCGSRGAATPSAGGTVAPQGSPDELLEFALRAGSAGDFDGYLALVHPNEKSNAAQVTNIREFSWKRFARQATWYRDPSGRVQIDRRTEEGADVMLYVHDFHNAGRLPPPLRVRQEGGVWRIVTSSL
jgi:hypothetical protein